MNEQTIFTDALERDPGERSAYLDGACGKNKELRERVANLIRLHEKAGNFLGRPAGPAVATIDQPPVERPGTQIGPYKLLQQIGEGGMGTVYMAEQKEPVQRKVALKVIKPGMDSRQVIARFEAERQALAMMDHVNIARVLDAGATESGRPYFVMELVHGVPITKYCDDNRLTPRQRLELFVPVCQAIQHAHQKGIIHRDIKPSNVMVTLYDGKPVPKVIDFGVAKATEQKLTERTLFTQYGTMVGTLEYMSPEQAEMSALGVDTRSDIYSLGVLLYELLTGSTPLSSKRMKEAAYAEILRLIKEEEPPKPSTRLSESGEHLASISAQRHTEPAKLSKLMRGELDWIVMKTLEKDRNRRYETANGFAADVQRYLNDEPVQACPPSTMYRFRKFARRNKRALTMTSMVALSMMLVVGSLGWMVRDRTAREAELARDRAARQMVLEREVELAIQEAGHLQKLAKWPEALSAVKRAETSLVAGGADDGSYVHIRELRKDLEMAILLEEIRLQQAASKGDDFFDEALADPAYAEAFRNYGIDVDVLGPADAAEWIRARSIPVELAAALDDWAMVCSLSRPKGDTTSKHLLAIARVADPDAWRNQMREVLIARVADPDTWRNQIHVGLKGDRTQSGAMKQLIASIRPADLPPSTLVTLATLLRKSGAYQEAVTLLREGQQRHPGDFWINFWLANNLGSTRPPQLDESLRFITAAVALRPDSPGVHLELASAFSGKRWNDQALAACNEAIRLKRDSAIAYDYLGNTLQRMGRNDDALAAHKEAIRLKPNFAEAHLNLGCQLRDMGRIDEAFAAFREAVRLRPEFSFVLHNELGLALHAKGRVDEAIAAHKEAIRLRPDYAISHYNLGISLHDKGRVDEAIAAFKEAIRLKPDDAIAHYNLSISLTANGRVDEAIAALQEAIRLKPDMSRAHVNLGIVLRDKGQYDEAIACFRQAITMDPGSYKAHHSLGAILANNKGDYAAAIAALREAISVNLGTTNAPNAFREADRLKDRAACLSNLASLLAGCPDPKLRDAAQALELAKQVAQSDPESVPSWQLLGWAHYRTGAWKASIEALEKSIELQKDGGDTGQWFILAMAHWQLDQKAEARKWYDRAVAWMDKNQETLKKNRLDWEIVSRFRMEAAELLEIKK